MDSAVFLPPLNVIARTLQLEFGRVPLIGFGVFDSPGITTLDAAQQRCADLLLATLPTTPQAILVYGNSLVDLVEDLRAAGHRVSIFAPSQPYREGSLSTLAGTCQSLRETEQQGPFDLILQLDSIRYPDQLYLLSITRCLLRPGGQLIWTGEFITERDSPGYEEMPLLQSFQRLSARLGFDLSSSADLTSAVLPGLEIMNRLLEKHRQRLVGENEFEQSAIQAAASRLLTLQQKFSQGSQVYMLFRFGYQAESGERIEYGDINSFSSDEVAQLFESSFGRPFNPDIWNWKYGGGRGRAVIARKNDQVVAHYGGAPREVEYFGSPARAIQICDVMVLPEERKFYGTESLFFKTAATFLEREIGYTVEHLLGFGFPNLKAMHIATRLGLYEKTDDFVEVFLPRDMRVESTPELEFTPLDKTNPANREVVNQLWRSLRDALRTGITGVRDWDYICYRYLQHPYKDYRLFMVYEQNTVDPLAMVVLRPHDDALLLMDLIGTTGSFPQILKALHFSFGRTQGVAGLKCWITRGWHNAILPEGAILRDLNIEIPCHSWSPGPSSQSLYGKWWLTAGDMDFL
ncbi:MAG: GNAT family N-acetyltransferase [Pseudohongiellaceae bacterium]